MEDQFIQFTAVDQAFFERVDKIIEDSDYVSQAIFIFDMIKSLYKEEDMLNLTLPVSVIASIVCDQDEDIDYDNDGYVSDDCEGMKFSDAIYDLWFENRQEEVLPYIECELVKRERYELLNEIQKLKNEKNA